MSRLLRWRSRVRHQPSFAPLRLLLGLSFVLGAIALASAAAELLPTRLKGAAPLCLAAAALVGYALFVRIVEQRPVVELVSPRWPQEALAGLAIGCGLFALVMLVLVVLGNYSVAGVNGIAVVGPALALSISAGVTEELAIRAVVFRILEGWLGSWWALAISAALFGVLHIANPNATIVSAAAVAIEAGILLGAAYMITRRVWLAIGIHIAWNFTQSGIFGVATSGIELAGYLDGRLHGHPLVSGGSFGPEASVVAVVVCVGAGVAMIRVAIARGHLVPPSWSVARQRTEPLQ